jgi:hypothetical protein
MPTPYRLQLRGQLMVPLKLPPLLRLSPFAILFALPPCVTGHHRRDRQCTNADHRCFCSAAADDVRA